MQICLPLSCFLMFLHYKWFRYDKYWRSINSLSTYLRVTFVYCTSCICYMRVLVHYFFIFCRRCPCYLFHFKRSHCKCWCVELLCIGHFSMLLSSKGIIRWNFSGNGEDKSVPSCANALYCLLLQYITITLCVCVLYTHVNVAVAKIFFHPGEIIIWLRHKNSPAKGIQSCW